jgi:tetratricopeptide (TPR) repeat protein
MRTCLSLVLLAALLGLGVSNSASASDHDASTGTRYSAAALYDLGNAAARYGRPAEAILDYERARLLAPRDADIRANLHYVREQAGLPQPVEFSQYARLANPNILFWLGTFGIALFGGASLLRRLTRKRRLPWAGATLGIALTALSIADAIATAPVLHEAVVMRVAAAAASPVGAAEPLFTLAPGDVVRNVDAHGNFVLVRDLQNREGWVASSALAPIIPTADRL